MRSHNRNVTHPIALIMLSLLVFLLLDNGLFRSGLYARVASPDSLINVLFYVTDFEKHRPTQSDHEVLLMGNSHIEMAFSIVEFEKRYPSFPLTFIPGTAPGTQERAWYYELKEIDPTHQRYKAIILPLGNYRATTFGLDEQNNAFGAESVAPILSLRDWPGYLNGFTDPKEQEKVLVNALFRSHNYSLDLQDFILHPIERLQKLHNLYIHRERWRLSPVTDKDGKIPYDPDHWRSLEGFKYDFENHKVISFPPHMYRGEALNFANVFDNVPTESDAQIYTARNAAYAEHWLNKIAKLYQNSSTVLVFVQMPREPFFLPGRQVLPTSPDIRDKMPKRKTIVFMDDRDFTFLEQPKYFWDADHLNQDGADLFVNSFGKRVEQVLHVE